MEKILTVVIPTYNMEKYLDRCLTSLIVEDEKMNRLEVLVVIDGAKDRSSEIAHTYEAKYPQTFRVIDKENGNYGSCVNRGLAEAAGKYIKVLDADDYFENANLAEYLSFLETATADAIITETHDVQDGKTIGELHFDDIPSEVVLGIEDLPANDIKILFMHSITYNAAKVRQTGYVQLEGISYTDLQWVTEPMMGVSTIQCWHKLLYNYVKGREGQTVEGSVHCKNMWMETKCVTHCIESYAQNKSNLLHGQDYYLNQKLMSLSSAIYKYFLIDYKDLLPEQELRKFDNSIKDRAKRTK